MAGQRKWWAVARPFVRGMVTDKPPWAIRDQESVFAQDGIAPAGVFDKRYGWEYDGSQADVAANLVGVSRVKFALANVVRTLTSSASNLYIHNAAGAGTSVASLSSGYYPQCVYNDMAVWCSGSGGYTLLYGGAGVASSTSATDASTTVGEATLTKASNPWSPTPVVGMFFLVAQHATNMVRIRARCLKVTSTSYVTLEGIRASAVTQVFQSATPTATARLFTCVTTKSVGTATVAAGVATGYGTSWTADLPANDDACLLIVPPTGNAEMGVVFAVTNDTTCTVYLSAQATKSAVHVVKAPQWTCAAAHKGSLFGAGQPEWPARLYAGPTGWNPLFPPGAVPPLDPAAAASNADKDFWLLDTIDVPAFTDGDPIMALISTPGPLLVPKKQACYRVDGTYPNFDVGLVDDGAGCLDVRSAISVDNRAIWAGENGVFTFDGRRAINLTEGRIGKEWRALVNEWDTNSYVSCGISDRFLFVGGKFGSTKRLYCYDMVDGTWISRFSNITPRAMFTARIADEIEALFVVDDDRQGRVLDIAPCVTGKKVTARDAQTKAAADALDDAGTGPVMKAWTGSIPANDDTDRESRFMKVAVSTDLHDTGAAGASTLAVTTTHSGRTDSASEETVAAGTISSDATDIVDRNLMRVGVRGRRHGVKVEAGQVASTITKSEIHEIAVETLDYRPGR